jgi:hypothetical protein
VGAFLINPLTPTTVLATLGTGNLAREQKFRLARRFSGQISKSWTFTASDQTTNRFVLGEHR